MLNDLAEDLRGRIARRLEQGDDSRVAGLLEGAWRAWAARRVARPLHLPAGVRTIGVGSAVLGGAGKTPLAIALAHAIARRGGRVAIVGHGYRADPRRARVVDPADAPGDVGDDALAAARSLVGTSAAVVVAPRRQIAVDLAASLGFRTLILDGLLQAAPVRLTDAILVVDAGAPWGAFACPPAGDLRAPPRALRAAADHVAVITRPGTPRSSIPGAVAVPSRTAFAVAASGERLPLGALAGARVGLLVTVARPDRIASVLRAAGLSPDPILALADHASPSSRVLARAVETDVSFWLTTPRCAVKLPPAIGCARVLVLDHRLEIRALSVRLRALND